MSFRSALAAFLLLPILAGCDSAGAAEQFEAEAAAPASGITKTDGDGTVLSDDPDDWRTSPVFHGKVRVDPAWPNPTRGQVVIVPVSVLEFDGVRGGGLVLRAQDNSGRLSILAEILDASSPGAYTFQFTPARIARIGLVRLFIFDRLGDLVSYGDLSIE